MTVKEQLKELENHCYYLWEISFYTKENDYIAMTDCYCSDDILKEVYESEYADKECLDWHFSYCEDGTSLILTIENFL
jgi:hypothetical protein